MEKSVHVDNSSGRNRLLEIIGVIRRHNVITGLTPQKLMALLEDLGPTFVKLGQIMSMQPETLPAEYCKELAKLKTHVTPMSFDEVTAILENEYGSDWNEVFAEIEADPLGSASIAQVHMATLSDGSRVVIKVQRTGIYDRMSRDIILFKKAAKILKFTPVVSNEIDLNIIIDEMWTASKQEMNFVIEAQNIEEFDENNKDVLFVTCPKIIKRYSTSKILVMEYIDGCFIDNIDFLLENGYDLDEIAKKLANNYVKQVIEDSFFHADPHSGNILIRNGKIVWIDLGMMGRLSLRDKKLLSEAIIAIANTDIQRVKDFILSIGIYKDKINHAALSSDIENMLNKYGTMDFSTMDLALMTDDFITILKEHRIGMPKGVSILGRGLTTIQGTLRTLSPNINLIEILVDYLSADLLKNFNLKKEIETMVKSIHFSFKKSLDIPAQISDTLKMFAKGITKVNLELLMSDEMSSKADRMLNKLLITIITAALLIGSSLICTTDMRPKLFGIPFLGVVGFMGSLILGGWLIFSIIKKL